MAEGLTISLLSGLIGALIASVIAIGYNEISKSKERKRSLAREKLEKVYGPLVALKKKNDEINQNETIIITPSNPLEKEMIERIIFNYYHLIDDDLKEGIIMLHPDISRDTMRIFKNVQFNVTDKIIKHYNENKNVLGLK